MTEHHNGGIPWILPAYHGYLEETPYKFTLKQIADPKVSCRPNRGGTDKPFFLLNNWIESSVPPPTTPRGSTAMTRSSTGRWPVSASGDTSPTWSPWTSSGWATCWAW